MPLSLGSPSFLLAALVAIGLPTGCGTSSTGTDASTTGDAGDPACEVPDRTCPEDQPVGGAPCEGELSCPYPQGRGFDGDWVYTCEAGAWLPGDAPCSALPGGGCAPPPLAERCRSPFTGTLAAVVRVGPPTAGELRPFADGELVEPVLGGQGSAMIELQLAIEGADEVRCATVSMTVTHDGVSSDPAVSNTAVHCGETRRVFLILPGTLPCGEGRQTIRLDVDVAGLGATSVALEIDTDLTCTLG